MSYTSGAPPAPMPTLHALMPTRKTFEVATNPGAAFLSSAGFDVRLLPGYRSIFTAYTLGVAELAPQDDDSACRAHTRPEPPASRTRATPLLARSRSAAGRLLTRLPRTQSWSSRTTTSPSTA